jgi:hypothetical protein
MYRFLKLFVILFYVFFFVNTAIAEEYKVLVLPDNIQFNSTNYLVYPDSSVMFASDSINEIKKSGRLRTVSMNEIRDALRKNTKLNILTKNALKEFKYNYNIPFVDFKAIATYFGTNKVLAITSQTDVQNYFLKRTIWDFLNIPGLSVVDPTYRLSTYAALIDVDKEEVLWQQTYYKNISSMENRIIALSFAPATEQLEKIKFYSTYVLSPTICKMVEAKILPVGLPNENFNIFVNTTPRIKSKEVVIPKENFILPQQNITPIRIKTKNYGEIINDL